jgi:choline kinase
LQPSPVYSLRSQISTLRLDSQDDDEDVQSTGKSEQVLFSQVLDWLRQEQGKRTATDSGTSAARSDSGFSLDEMQQHSFGPEKGLALDQLEKILHHYATTSKDQGNALTRQPSRRHRHSRSKGLRRGSGSDSDYYDETGVPSVDAILDNTKTLAYNGGASSENLLSGSGQQTRASKETNHWLTFKAEILRLAHTLRLKGWRSVGMDSCGDIEVTRLSGALTNAVYVVKPPKLARQNSERIHKLVPRRLPP